MAIAPRPDAITAVSGIRVGHWSDRRRATGCTVVLCEPGAVGGYHCAGGAPGTIETDLLRPENWVSQVHAVLLSGGSAFGLAAATGVRAALAERGLGLRLDPALPPIPIVVGAALFDLRIGSASAYSDEAAGRRAVAAATGGAIQQGSVGAGTGGTVAKAAGFEAALKGGIGSAAVRHESGLVVGALAAVNVFGDVVDPDTGALAAGPRGSRRPQMQRTADLLAQQSIAQQSIAQQSIGRHGGLEVGPAFNTTVAVVATNARLDKAQATRLAIMANAGLAQAVRPAHTPFDGDTVFALATGAHEAAVTPALQALLGGMGATALARAIVRGVEEAEGLGGVPSVREWRRRAR